MENFNPSDPTTTEDNRKILLAVFAGFALSVLLGLLSDGVYHDDDLTHFLMARWAWWYPEYLLHIWGRPGLTWPLAAVSWIGDRSTAWHLARGLSAVVTAATAYFAARYAHGLGMKRAWLVVAACYAQPLNMLLSFTTLAENYAALYLMLAALLLQRRRLLWASMIFSLTLLTRHEAVVFLPVWILALIVSHTSWRVKGSACLLAFWAPVVHNLLYVWRFHRWPILIFTRPHGSTEYLPTGPLSYLPDAMYAISPLLLGLALIGGWALCRRKQLLAPAMALIFLLTHTLIKALGLYASGGYGRYMVTVASFIAILAAAGLNAIIDPIKDNQPIGRKWIGFFLVFLLGWIACELEIVSGRWHTTYAQATWAVRILVGIIIVATLWLAFQEKRKAMGPLTRALILCLVVTGMAQWIWIVHPLRQRPQHKVVGKAIAWMKEHHLGDAPLFATDPWFPYFLNLSENPRAYKDAALLASMPVGTVFVWDSIYSGNDFHSLRLKDYFTNQHYQLINRMTAAGHQGFSLYIFRKIRQTPIPKPRAPRYPAPMINGQSPIRGIFYRQTR